MMYTQDYDEAYPLYIDAGHKNDYEIEWWFMMVWCMVMSSLHLPAQAPGFLPLEPGGRRGG
jgi:hypothetical protein